MHVRIIREESDGVWCRSRRSVRMMMMMMIIIIEGLLLWSLVSSLQSLATRWQFFWADPMGAASATGVRSRRQSWRIVSLSSVAPCVESAEAALLYLYIFDLWLMLYVLCVAVECETLNEVNWLPHIHTIMYLWLLLWLWLWFCVWVCVCVWVRESVSQSLLPFALKWII